MAAGLMAVLILTLVVFRVPVGPSLHYLFTGAFADKFGIGRTVVKSTPLLLTGLGVVVAWRSGMYNIGGEGQFIMGGLAGAWLASFLLHKPGVPPEVTQVAILLVSILGGAAYGLFAGWLKVKRGVDVVISTILLNFIALKILGWAVEGPLMDKAHGLPLTESLPDTVMLYHPDKQTDLHIGALIALGAAVAVFVFLYFTRKGFLLRVVGDNPDAARSNRIDADRIQLLAMAVSGGLCGLAGAVEYTGIAGQLGSDFSQNWGFLAIPVALLGGLHPLWLILSALYFGALIAGSVNLSRFTPAGDTLIYIVQAAAVLGLVAIQAMAARVRSSRGAVEA